MTTTTTLSKKSNWSILQRVLFRFGFVYTILFTFYYSFGLIPYGNYILVKRSKLTKKIVFWIEEHFVSVQHNFYPDMSVSDTTYSYLLLLSLLIISSMITVIWLVLDRKRKSYSTLLYWLKVVIRYYVALMLFKYGLGKFYHTQFPPPNINLLLGSYGESYPMGLAWTFLGFSKGYNIFMGIAEVSALLLLYRKTAILGSLIAFAVSLNILVINIFFDVPMKLLVIHLVLMALFILLTKIKPLIRFFIKGESAKLSIVDYVFIKNRKRNISLRIGKYIIIGLVMYNSFDFPSGLRKYYDNIVKQPLYGLYDIKTLIINKDTIPPLLSNKKRWKYVDITNSNYLSFKNIDRKSNSYYKYSVDTIKKEILFKNYKDTTKVYTMNFSYKEHMFTFNTVLEKDTIIIKTKKLSKDDFTLMNKGIRWISDRPFSK